METEDCDFYCDACDTFVPTVSEGDPAFVYKNIKVCTDCAIDMILPIYQIMGLGGIQHIIFKSALTSGFNRKRRKQITNYRKVFKELLHRYNFRCVHCGETEEKKLTIDHIKPVSKGGGDEVSNLQILCKSCNSRKGAK